MYILLVSDTVSPSPISHDTPPAICPWNPWHRDLEPFPPNWDLSETLCGGVQQALPPTDLPITQPTLVQGSPANPRFTRLRAVLDRVSDGSAQFAVRR